MKFSDYITAQAKKVGVDLTDPKFADILAVTIDIPDDLAGALEKGLMTVDAAVNNPAIRNKIKAEVYNGVDSDVNSLLDGFELDDATKTDILSEKKSIDRIKKLASHLKEQSDKAAKSGDKSQADALKKQVEELNNQIKTIKTDSEKTIDQLKADNENSLIGFNVKSILGSKKYTLPEAMKPEEQVETVWAIVNQELQQKGLKLMRENGALKLLKADGTDPYNEKNEKLELHSFLDGALAQRGLLKVSDPNNPGGSGNGNVTPQNVSGKDVPVIPQTSQAAIGEIDKLIQEATARDN
jgi:gas vesicle protein